MKIGKFLKENNDFYLNSREDISKSNSKNLKKSCIIYGIVLIFYTIASILIKESQFLINLYFLFDTIHLFILVLVLLRKDEKKKDLTNTQIYCGIFELTALLFFLIEGVFVYSDRGGIYIPLIILAIVVIFTHKATHALGITLLYLISFVVLSKNCKTSKAFEIDLFLALATFITTIICYFIISSLRQTESKLRKQIKEDAEVQKVQLQEEKNKALAASTSKGDFLSQMSHDMRTPMNAIIGMTYLAKEEKPKKIIEEYLDNIDISSNYLLGLINDVLDLSKIESGKIELREEPYSVDDFFRGIDIVIKPLMKAKNIEFIIDAEGKLDNIIVDRLRFNQIFYNVLSNAAKYTPVGGRVEFITEGIPNVNGKHGMRFHIKDNGIGMSEEFLKTLFEPFTREKSDKVYLQQGTGLGLSIVKKLIDIMGGRIEVKSEINKGTEFIIDLYANSTNELSVPDDIVYEEFSLLSGLHILLVEDNELNRIVAGKILEAKDCIVDYATNGQEAVEMFTNSSIDYYTVILMDVRMPVMNGLEATKQIRNLEREDAKTIKIFAMTADAFNENILQAKEAGMDDHLAKPVNPKLIYNKIMNIKKKGITN